MKIAIVHDWLTNMGGAERVVEAFHEIYPDAPIYTTVFNPKKLAPKFSQMDVHTSFIQKLPFAQTKYQKYLPFFPLAFEQFDLREYDVVISNSHCCAKGVVTNPETLHICYCSTPIRYAWDLYHEYMEREKLGWLSKKIIPLVMNYLRMWVVITVNRVDYFIANSNTIKQRIKKHYRRNSDVIYPPVNTSYYLTSDEDRDFFLVVSRFVPYKRIDLAIEAFNELGWPLVIIGDGPERKRLEKMAKPNINFLGRQSDEIVREHYAKCRAFIFPGEEDFGITPVEAQSAGRPVIAYGKGGALDTVTDGVTGILFKQQSKDSLVEALRKFETMSFNKQRIREHALKFDVEKFKQKIKQYIEEKYQEHRKNMEG